MHELHQADCVWLPIRKGMVKLGSFDTDRDAFEKATALYEEITPCSTCCSVGKKKSTPEAKS